MCSYFGVDWSSTFDCKQKTEFKIRQLFQETWSKGNNSRRINDILTKFNIYPMENILKYSSSETTELFENKLLAGMLLGWSAIKSLWIVQDDGHYAKINHFSQKNRHV